MGVLSSLSFEALLSLNLLSGPVLASLHAVRSIDECSAEVDAQNLKLYAPQVKQVPVPQVEKISRLDPIAHTS